MMSATQSTSVSVSRNTFSEDDFNFGRNDLPHLLTTVDSAAARLGREKIWEIFKRVLDATTYSDIYTLFQSDLIRATIILIITTTLAYANNVIFLTPILIEVKQMSEVLHTKALDAGIKAALISKSFAMVQFLHQVGANLHDQNGVTIIGYLFQGLVSTRRRYPPGAGDPEKSDDEISCLLFLIENGAPLFEIRRRTALKPAWPHLWKPYIGHGRTSIWSSILRRMLSEQSFLEREQFLALAFKMGPNFAIDVIERLDLNCSMIPVSVFDTIHDRLAEKLNIITDVREHTCDGVFELCFKLKAYGVDTAWKSDGFVYLSEQHLDIVQQSAVDHIRSFINSERQDEMLFTRGASNASAASELLEILETDNATLPSAHPLRAYQRKNYAQRVLEHCIGLQSLKLPVLILVQIMEDIPLIAPAMNYYDKWNVVTTIRHFGERDDQNAASTSNEPYIVE